MTAQDMWNLLTLKAQEGEIESLDIPKVTTIQGWITRYVWQTFLSQKSASLQQGTCRFAADPLPFCSRPPAAFQQVSKSFPFATITEYLEKSK